MTEGVTEYASLDGSDVIVSGVRHHIISANHHDDGPGTYLVACGSWCECL
jgi:hypothetical protein